MSIEHRQTRRGYTDDKQAKDCESLKHGQGGMHLDVSSCSNIRYRPQR